jgi:hypothetical protein
MTIETIKSMLYTCGCGYKTLDKGNSAKHKKVSCGHSMTNELTEFVMKKYYDIAIGKKGYKGVTVSGSNNLPVPQKRTIGEDFVDYRDPM